MSDKAQMVLVGIHGDDLLDGYERLKKERDDALTRIAELEGARENDSAELERLRAEHQELSDQFITNAQRLGSVCYSWHNWAVEIVGKEAARRMSWQDMRDEIARRLAGRTTDQAETRKRRGPGPDGPPKAGDPQDADKDGAR
jgi:chromosome segregation ATPase